MVKAFQFEPETSVQDFVSTFLSMKTHFPSHLFGNKLNISDQISGQFLSHVVTEPGKHNIASTYNRKLNKNNRKVASLKTFKVQHILIYLS